MSRRSDEAQELIDWFLTTEPPSEPLLLKSGVRIAKPDVYWKHLRLKISESPGGARSGGLLHDLAALRKALN